MTPESSYRNEVLMLKAALNKRDHEIERLNAELSRIPDLEARLAAAEAELRENEGVIAVWRRRAREAEDDAQMRGTMCRINEYELDVLRDAISDLEARLAATNKQRRESDEKLTNQRHEINWLKEQQQALKDSLAAAEAGEDALAEGARIGLDSFKDHPFILNDKEQATVERITAALAAYEARRKG